MRNRGFCLHKFLVAPVCGIASFSLKPFCYLRPNFSDDRKIVTRHRASTSMYSLTFCVRFLLPERHQWKPAVQTAAVMLRTPPSAAGRPRLLPVCGARFWGRPPDVPTLPTGQSNPGQNAATYIHIAGSLLITKQSKMSARRHYADSRTETRRLSALHQLHCSI